MRLTQKNEIFEYVLPEQNTVGDNQATEISLGETEYTCKKYIIGEAIKEFGELEDVLESWHIENLEELKTRLHDCQVYHLKNNSNETLIHNLKNELADLQHRLEVAEKALELACKYNIPDDEHSHITLRFSDTGVQIESWQELKEYALKQAEKEIKGE